LITNRDGEISLCRPRNLKVAARTMRGNMGGIEELCTMNDILTSALNLPFELRDSYLKLLVTKQAVRGGGGGHHKKVMIRKRRSEPRCFSREATKTCSNTVLATTTQHAAL
jgi:hypothetical protein